MIPFLCYRKHLPLHGKEKIHLEVVETEGMIGEILEEETEEMTTGEMIAETIAEEEIVETIETIGIEIGKEMEIEREKGVQEIVEMIGIEITSLKGVDLRVQQQLEMLTIEGEFSLTEKIKRSLFLSRIKF